MTEDLGRELQRRRLELGLTLRQVADGTAVPADYLHALEEGARHQLPPGYADAYGRTYRRFLERAEARAELVASGAVRPGDPVLDPGFFPGGRPTGSVPTVDGEDAPPSDPVVRSRPVPRVPAEPTGLPYATVRRLAVASTLSFLLLAIWQITRDYEAWRSMPRSMGPEPIEVRVLMRRNARLAVRVDGRVAAQGLFPGREEASWVARDRIEIDVPDVQSLRVWLNDRPIHPRGHQGRPRTLAFINDGRAP